MNTPGDNPQADRMLRWFEYGHLHPDLQPVSQMFTDLAHQLRHALPAGAETTTTLRKLLEAKDCAVRAAIEGLDEGIRS